MIELTVHMDPVAKGRPRFAVMNGKPRRYTPEKTVEAEQYFAALFQEHKPYGFSQYTPVKLTVEFFIKKPKWKNKEYRRSEYGKRAGKWMPMPSIRSDLDNYVKLVTDAMNEILFHDDCQITTINASKRWSENGQGYVTIKLEEDNGEAVR